MDCTRGAAINIRNRIGEVVSWVSWLEGVSCVIKFSFSVVIVLCEDIPMTYCALEKPRKENEEKKVLTNGD